MTKRPAPPISAALADKMFWRNVNDADPKDLHGSVYLGNGAEALLYRRSEQRLIWVARNGDGEPIGAGSFRDRGWYYESYEASVLKSEQRHGIYSNVLRGVVQTLGKTVVSDSSLTRLAIGAWKKAGATLEYWDGDPRYVLTAKKR